MSLRTAVIGIGCMGSAHAMSIFRGDVEGMTLCAVCDISPERLSWARENLGPVGTYGDYKQMLSEVHPDAVIVATPHRLHADMSIAALESGAHVVCEKPVTVSVSDAQRVIAAAERTGKRYCVMFNQRTHPVFARARKIVRSGELGEIKRVDCTVTNWYRTQSYYDSGSWRATWSGEGGGVLINQAPHNLDLLQWICGMPESVRAWCECGKYHNIETEDEAVLFMRGANGAVYTFTASTGEYPGTNRLEIAGTLGKLVCEDGKLRQWGLPVSERELCFSQEPLPTPEYSEYFNQPVKDGHIIVLEDFARAVGTGGDLLCPGEEGICELSISNAAYLSAWTDRTINLPITDTALFDDLLAHLSQNGKVPAAHSSNADGSYSPRWEVRW